MTRTKRQSLSHTLILIVVLIGLVLLARLIPHPHNMTPMIAVGLFSFYYLGRRVAWLVPLTALFVSDLFIGFYERPLMLVVYASFALTTLFGYLIARSGRAKMLGIGAAALCASTFFFLTTNFAVWFFSPWYPDSFAGLMSSYLAGLPFFKNMLLGDLAYTFGLFSAYQLFLSALPQFRWRSQALDYQPNPYLKQ